MSAAEQPAAVSSRTVGGPALELRDEHRLTLALVRREPVADGRWLGVREGDPCGGAERAEIFAADVCLQRGGDARRCPGRAVERDQLERAGADQVELAHAR